MQCWQKKVFLLFFLGWIAFVSKAQTGRDSVINTKDKTTNNLKQNTNTTLRNNTNALKKDSAAIKDSIAKLDSLTTLVNNENHLLHSGYSFLNTYTLLSQQPLINKITPKKPATANNDGLFYLLSFIVLLLAIIKLAFPKHLVNVFSIFFQTNYRQKQTKDQLLQDTLAHVGLMLVFFGSTSVFAATLLSKKNIFTLGFWQLLVICFIILVGVYSLKYVFINFLGVLFKEEEASTTYIFLVFLINKLIGVLLIPAITLISFSTNQIANTALLISYIVVGILLLYRVFLTFKSVSNRLNINIFQFFLYFCGVEILPLLLIYKTSVLYGQ